ncbi:MAG: BatD family protein [Desulfobacteraceae bacterium]
MKKIGLYMVIFLVFMPFAGFCFDVTVQVDKTRIAMGDSILYRVDVQGGEAKVDTSVIEDFKVISRGTATRVNIVNGEYSKTLTSTYVLLPLKEGKLTIPSLPVAGSQKKAYTRKIQVEVTKDPVGEHSFDKVFARASLSSDDLFVGEQSLYTIRFYTCVDIARASLDKPSFSGFLAKEAGKQEKYSETINNKTYQVTKIDYLLVPEKTGKVVIDPAAIVCKIPSGDRQNPFGDSFFSNNFFGARATKTRRVATEAISVRVKPLPVYKGNSSFSGLVGEFDIQAGIDRKNLAPGESATLTITVSGTGNVMDAALPPLSFSDGFKVYDDEPKKEIFIDSQGYTGKKVFKKAVVPVRPGSFVIDPVTLTWFDVNTRAYRSASTTPITVSAESKGEETPHKTADQENKPNTPAREKKPVEITGHDILGLKEGGELLTSKSAMPFPLFLFLLLLPGGCFLVLKLFLAFTQREADSSAVMEKRARKSLKEAWSDDLDKTGFLRRLYTALVSKVLSLAGKTGESLTRAEAADILLSRGHSEDTVKQVEKMLFAIESARYSGAVLSPKARKELLKGMKRLFRHLGVLLVVASSFFLFSGPARADDSGTLFLKGVKAYRTGEYERSGQLFEKIVHRGVENGKLYYNIGNAYLKAGDTGRAVLWYERAKKLIPGDADLLFNLDYAGRLVADEQEKKSFDLSDLVFFWQDLFSSKTVEYAALAASLIFFLHAGIRLVKRKRSSAWLGGVLFVVFVITASAALFDYYDSKRNRCAVILSKQAAVRSGVSDKATVLFTLHAGTKVRVEKTRDDYFRIFFARGKIGWIQRQSCEII